MAKMPETCGVSAAARLLNLSEPRIAQLADAGTLPSTRDHANRRIFKLADVYAVMRLRQKQSSRERDVLPVFPMRDKK